MRKKMHDLSMLQSKYVREPYNAIVDTYHRKHFDEKIFDELIEKFSSMLSPGSLVLDAGCGPGGETKKLLQKNLLVKSIDISEKMLKKARENVPRGDFINMDLMDLRFPKNYFYGIWSARALIHVPTSQLAKTLRGFYKVLKPNGVLCAVVLKGKGEGIEPEIYDKSKKTKTFFRYFQKGELEENLAKQEFEILDSRTIFKGKEKEVYLAVFASKPKFLQLLS